MISQDTKSAFHSVSPSPPPTSTNSNSSQQLTTKMTNFSIAAIMHTKLIQQQQQQSEQQLQVVRAASAAAAAAAALHQAAAMKQPQAAVSPSTADQFSHHGIPELKRQRISGSSPKIQSGKIRVSLSTNTFLLQSRKSSKRYDVNRAFMSTNAFGRGKTISISP